MSGSIHPTAIVDPSAELAADVVVGPYARIGAGVTIGSGTTIGAVAQVEGPTRIGSDNRVFPQACIGFEPQDLKFGGEEVFLEIGDRNVFREFSTVHRGTGKGGGLTTVGDDNLFMVFTHVAHDCHVGSRTIFSNNATLAGHVEVHDDATVGAFSAVHQFCRVGRHAYIGGFSVITMDVLPFSKCVGQKPAFVGVNRIGLERKGFDKAALERVEAAMRVLVRSGLNAGRALEVLAEEQADSHEAQELVRFVSSSERGVIRRLPTRRARGGGAA